MGTCSGGSLLGVLTADGKISNESRVLRVLRGEGYEIFIKISVPMNMRRLEIFSVL